MDEGKESALIRVLYTVLFYVIYGLTDLLVLFLALVQTCFNLFGSGPSRPLTDFGSSLAVYLKQIVRYLSYTDEAKPFPFSDWPEPELKQTED